MSKRKSKEPVEIEIARTEPEDEYDDVECEPQQPPIIQEVLRTCISCGSTANLFKTKKHKTCIECCNLRPGKTEKQLEAFSKARERRMENISSRKQTIKELEDKAREELDSKIVSKAISIKKKQIKKNAELDEISDDDTPLEEVMKIAKKPKPVQQKKSVAISEPLVRQRQQTQQPKSHQQIPQEQYVPQIQQPQSRTFKFL
jgi:uncharacterized protein (UPF0335 family)